MERSNRKVYPLTYDFEEMVLEADHQFSDKMNECTDKVRDNMVELVGECEHDPSNLDGMNASPHSLAVALHSFYMYFLASQ
jgi:hypothetical protein